MNDRRKTPRPDRLFVDSRMDGDIETITVSTIPGDLGEPILSNGPRCICRPGLRSWDCPACNAAAVDAPHNTR